MKYLILTLLALTLSVSASEKADPFGGKGTSLTDEVQNEKIYVLDIVYGDTIDTLPSKDSVAVISDAFLKTAKKISISTNAEDSGIIEREDGAKVVYRIKNFKTEFSLKICFIQHSSSGGSETNTELSLIPGEWISLETSSSHESKTLTSGEIITSHTYSYAFARIQKRG
jgi:hypothetical protein